MTVAEKIKADIKAKGLKQYAVADKAGIERTVFYNLLNGSKRFNVDYLPKICKALGEKPSKYIDF